MSFVQALAAIGRHPRMSLIIQNERNAYTKFSFIRPKQRKKRGRKLLLAISQQIEQHKYRILFPKIF